MKAEIPSSLESGSNNWVATGYQASSANPKDDKLARLQELRPLMLEQKSYEPEIAFDFDPDNPDRALKIPANRFEEFNNHQGDLRWTALPTSIISTIVYFLLIEQNTSEANIYETLKAMYLIGLPSYLVYIVQIVIIYGLWQATFGDDASAISDSICVMSVPMLLAAIIVYLISMIPDGRDLVVLSEIILYSKKASYRHYGDSIYVTPLKASWNRRLVIFSCVIGVEIIITLFVTYVGIGYLLSSDNVSSLLMNSVSVVFIVQIDDMARESLQNEDISEHIDLIHFQRVYSSDSEEDKDISSMGQIKEPSDKTYRYFQSLELTFGILGVAFVSTFASIWAFSCYDNGFEIQWSSTQ
jgi:hypothetical protein